MKKILFYTLSLIIFLSSCQPKAKTNASIKDEIFAYKEQITNLNKKITELESQLSTDSLKTNKIKVKVLNLTLQPFEHKFEATGSVEAVKEAFISPEMSGQIKKIYVKEGDRVSKGKTLVSLNSSVLYNNLAELEVNLELAKTMYEKQKELWDKKIGSEVQYLQAKTQKESLERSVLTLKSQIGMSTVNAPFAGVVDQVFQKEGELGTPGMRIIQLVNLDYMFATAQISEKYLSSINHGDSVMVAFPSYPEMKIHTTVYQKGNIINPNNRTFEIKLKFKNKNNKIKPNLLTILTLKDYFNASTISVPTLIVNQDIKGTYVYVEDNKNGKKIAKKRYVETGRSNSENTLIISGLNENDKVITSGYHLVKDGTEIFY